LVHGYRLAETSLCEVWRDKSHGKHADRLDLLLEEVRKISEKRHSLTVFVACFSEDGDLLSQWRAYCPTGGVSIGFDKSQLMESLREQPFELGKCVYDPNSQIQLLRKHLGEIVDDCLAMPESFWSAPSYRVAQLNRLHMVLGRVVPLLKHAAFSEEREWRLFASVEAVYCGNGLTYEYRKRRDMIVPYTPISLDPIAWHGAELVMAPGPDSEMLARATQDMVGRRFLVIPRVRRSEIPYRGP
jgi:hypothetical protein